MSNNNPIFVGYEASNGYVKSYSNVTEEVDTYLNTLTEIDEDTYEREVENNSTNLKDPVTSQVYKVQFNLQDPMYFRVGKSITSEDQVFFSTDDKDKYEDLEWLAANFISIYRQIQSIDYVASTPIYLATGLPTNHSKDKALREQLKEVLKRQVEVNDKKFRIQDVAVVPQGDASFFNDLLTFEGEINQQFLAETKPEDEDQQSIILYYDIGFGTTDIKTVVDYSLDPDKVKELSGMEKVWTEVLNAAKAKNAELNRYDVLAVEKQLRTGGKININYEEANVTTERQKALDAFAKQLIDALGKTPFKKLVFNQVRFVGGGAIAMEKPIKDYLKVKYAKNLKHTNKFKFLDDIEESQFTNCYGFYKICVKKFQ